jgi:hypothetical protein
MDKGRMYGAYEPPPTSSVTPPAATVAPVRSAFLSKINWTSLAGPIAGVLAFVGIKDVSAEQIGYIMLGIQTAQSVATIIFRTFYTSTITPSSLGPPPGGG